MAKGDIVSIAATLLFGGVVYYIGGPKAAALAIICAIILLVGVQLFGGKEGTQKSPVAAEAKVEDSGNSKINNNNSPTFSPVFNNYPPPTQAHAPQPPPLLPAPNLVLTKINGSGLYFFNDVWTRNDEHLPTNAKRQRSVYAEIKNVGIPDTTVGPAFNVRAELVRMRGDRSETKGPLPWLDERFNTVRIDLGDSKFILLATLMPTMFQQVADWRCIINRRAYSDGTPGVSKTEFDNGWYVGSEIKLRLQLLDIKNGTITHTFDGLCRWRDRYQDPEFHF
jgi:hypothetical protein